MKIRKRRPSASLSISGKIDLRSSFRLHYSRQYIIDKSHTLLFRYFNRLLPDSASPHLVGSQLTYADLGLFHVVEGLKFAFPNALGRLLIEYPGVAALHAMYVSPSVGPRTSSDYSLIYQGG